MAKWRRCSAGRSLAAAVGLVNAACMQFRPPPTPPPAAMTGPYTTVWTSQAGRSISGDLVVEAGTVFLGGTDRTVYAVDLATGTVKWHHRLGGAILSGIQVANGTVYVGTDRPEGAVAAMDAATGQQRWRTREGRTGLPLAVGDGIVASHGRDGRITAFNPGSGEVLWRRRVGIAHTPPLAIDGAVVAFSEDSVFRLAPTTGAVLERAAGPGSVPGGWRRKDSLVIGGTAAGTVLAFNPHTLATIWEVRLDGPVLVSLGESADTLLAVTQPGTVWAVPAHGGKPRRLLTTERPLSAAPLTDEDGLLVAGADGSLRAYDPGGDEVWRINHWRPMTSAPVRLDDGNLLVIGSNGDLARYAR
jgi:outer membrane protein assembly factor BamB